MALFQKKRADDEGVAPGGAGGKAPPPGGSDGAGRGLPSRSLPKIVGALAVGFALYVAFSGPKAPQQAQQPAAPPSPQVNAKPQPSQIENILNEITGKKNGKRAHGATGDYGGSDASTVADDVLPSADNIKKQQAVKGNIAASNIIALRGDESLAGQGARPQPLPAQYRQPSLNVPSPQLLGPATSVSSLPPSPYGSLYGQKQDTRPEGERFLSQTASEAGDGYGPQAKILPPLPGAELFPGAVLPATTITAVNTQLPGTVIAQVTQDVYGRNGRIAVPRGSRLVGRYDSQVTNGQTRVLVAFQRVIFPDGRELVLGDAQSVDQQGTAGTKADVNNHFFKLLGASLLIALLDQGVAAAGPTQQVTNPSGSVYSGVEQSGAQAFAQAGQQILQPYLSLRPTAVIPAGTSINVLVNKTVVIPTDGDAP